MGFFKTTKRGSFSRNVAIAHIIFFISAVVFMLFIFSHLSKSEFLYPHDGPNSLSIEHIYQNGFIRNFDDGGISTAYQLSINYLNLVVYSIFYAMGCTVQVTQFILFSILFYVFGILSFIGFYKILSRYCAIEHTARSLVTVLITTLFYNYSLFGVLNINSGYFFSLNYLSFAVLPLLFFYTIRIITDRIITTKEAIFYAIIIAIAALNVAYIIPISFSLILFVLMSYPLKQVVKTGLKRIAFSMSVFVLFFLNFLSMFVFESAYNTNNFINENLKNSVAGSIGGGLLYQFLHYFNWGLYNIWSPKSVMTFAGYYLGNAYVLAIFSLYLIVLVACVRSKPFMSKITPFLAIFLVSIFFAKGPQQPIGEIFTFLVDHFSIFGTVRTPDNKFGITAVFALSVIILLLLNRVQTTKIFKYLAVYLVIFIGFCSWPLLNGEAILGKNNFPSSGRIVASVLPEYSEVLDAINNDKIFSNVLIYPQFSGVLNHDQELYVGRDILKTQSNKPFLYNSYIQSGDNILSKQISDVTSMRDLDSLKMMNIGYILVRKDDFENSKKINPAFTERIVADKIATLVVSNRYLELYKINDTYFTPRILLSDTNASVTFIPISPVQYRVQIRGLKGSAQMQFLESYNKHYRLYLQAVSNGAGISCSDKKIFGSVTECAPQTAYFKPVDLSYLTKRDVFNDTHGIANGYANGWTIDATYVKEHFSTKYYSEDPDGTISLELVLYYKPQSLFFLTAITSSFSFFACVVYLLVKKKKVGTQTSD